MNRVQCVTWMLMPMLVLLGAERSCWCPDGGAGEHTHGAHSSPADSVGPDAGHESGHEHLPGGHGRDGEESHGGCQCDAHEPMGVDSCKTPTWGLRMAAFGPASPTVAKSCAGIPRRAGGRSVAARCTRSAPLFLLNGALLR